jgi:CO/xanthine dehydrogenase FAD-binding subunit
MITEYHRPTTLKETLELLSTPNTRPLGGGTMLARSGDESFAVVDLQALGLDKLHKSDNNLVIGATVTLQALLESPYSPIALKTALKLEAPLNLRSMGTVAGTLVTCDGRSPFATMMLALDARLTLDDGRPNVYNLGDFLPLRNDLLKNRLITKIEIPLQAKLAFETVARSPSDKPIICTALASWPSGRTRLVIGGWGISPSLAMDGKDSLGLESAASNAAHGATDEWSSADYRSNVAVILAKRCMDKIMHDKNE